MQSVSQTWQDIYDASGGNPHIETRATINSTVYTDIGQPVITRSSMQNGISVGNVVSACCLMVIRTSDTIPKSASVVIENRLVGGTDDSPVYSEWLPAGTFYISKRSRDPVTGILTLESYDALLMANSYMPAQSAGYWPRAMASLASDIATAMGVTIDSRTTIATGAIYVVNEPAAGTAMRDLLGIIAAANGGNWIMTPDNKLRLVPILDAADADEATDDVFTVPYVLGSVYVGDAAEITGIRYTAGEALPVLIGDETGIVLDVSMSYGLADALATQLIGMTYQPFSLGRAIYNPAAEIGDYVVREDSFGSVLYSETVTLGGGYISDCVAPDPAEIADEYPYPGASEKALMQAKAYTVETVDSAIDTYDTSLNQQTVFNKLTNNGVEQGVILYDGHIYINAEYIQTGYLSASRIKGGSLTLGGSGNVNGTIDVKDAEGKTIGWWNRQGLGVTDGGGLSIGSYSDGSRIRTLSVVPTWDENRRVPSFQFEGYAENHDEYIVSISPGFLSVRWDEYDPDDESYSDKYEMKFDAYTGRLIMSADGRSKLWLDLAALRVQWSGDVVINGNYGVSGTFESLEGKQVTLTNGIITRLYGDDRAVAVAKGGTGATTAAAARTNLGVVAKAGDTMTGILTFSTTNGIAYQGTKAIYNMIRFIDNTGDATGNGIYIGGGGATIIGGGESAATAAAELTTGGSEIMYVCNDGDVQIHTNLQDNWASRKTFTFDTGGSLNVPNVINASAYVIKNEYINLTTSNNGSSTTRYVSICGRDANNRNLFCVEGYASSNGNVSAFLGVQNYNTSGTTQGWAGITITQTKAGALSYSVSSPDKFRSAISAVNIAGDTMTGTLQVTGCVKAINAGETYCEAQNSTTGVRVLLDSDGIGDHGVWSNGYWNGSSFVTSNKWMIYRGTDGNVVVNGNCTGSSASCTGNAANVTGTVAVGHGGTGATTYSGALENLHACRWIVSETDVLTQVKNNGTNNDRALFFTTNGITYSGAPTNDYYNIISCTPVSVGNAVSLLAIKYGGNDIYVGNVWRNGSTQPAWTQVVTNDGGSWGISITGSSASCTGNAANVTGTVAVGHGGTNATTEKAACSNLHAVSGIYIDDSTAANIAKALYNNSTAGRHIVVLFSSDASKIISKVGGTSKITTILTATVTIGGSDTARTYRVFGASGTGNYMYSFQFSASNTDITEYPSAVYRYAGSAI